MPWFLLSCATPVPKAVDYYRQVPQTDMGISVDLDLLAAAKLPDEKKRLGEKLLNDFHSAETSLTDYADALERNVEVNEQLSKQYAIADAIVGALAGFSSIGVVFATAAIAAPIAGAIWVGIGLTVQRVNIEPQAREARDRLKEVERLAQIFPDVERAFRALVFADSDVEADRRFKIWNVYAENLKVKVSRFFAKPVE
ncbi:MAG: hypothetical protein HY581_04580 [Nitrospirae bacterium]|nr:hypothetical protein [Nitrospirota bacterium]